MGKRNLVEGHAHVTDLVYWMDERHRIYQSRFEFNNPAPWSHDPIFQDYKFTNFFRELDKGTQALRGMVPQESIVSPLSAYFAVANIIWYRLFNRYEHAKNIGFCHSYDELYQKVLARVRAGDKMFTSAHMTWGKAGEPKWRSTMETMKRIWSEISQLTEDIYESRSLQGAFNVLMRRRYLGIGAFIAYEIITDLRHYPYFAVLTSDVHSWANIGPGCARGLRRLGFSPTLHGLRTLYTSLCPDFLTTRLADHWNINGHPKAWPPLELRELEHSLCEFDKYQRVKTGVGTPREKFNGRG